MTDRLHLFMLLLIVGLMITVSADVRMIRKDIADLRSSIKTESTTAIARHDSLMANIKKPVWWR